MQHLPEFISPQTFNDAGQALAQVKLIYDSSIAHLRQGMQRFVAGDDSAGPVRAV